ncbi:ankyrin repeat domain-containing protein [Salicola sp. Rm-C-2C1-2]|uniref:ankyrin repeat domain-containing protein n=1 Tax=Salicola sp. Rm-C-2C1-2 TaxID=3141321 RepID=UPI0032E4D9D4
MLAVFAGVASWLFGDTDLESRDKRGRTPLIVAAEEGDAARVKRLLERGARVDVEDSCQWTPLMRAASHGHLPIIKTLLEHGASVNHQGEIGFSALMASAINGHDKVARVLISHGADLSFQETETGKTALQLAIMNDDDAMIELLLNARS